MLKKFKKYFDFSANHNKHIEVKLKSAKNVNEGISVLEKAGWFITPQLVNEIKKDVVSENKDDEILTMNIVKNEEISMEIADEKEKIDEEIKYAGGGKASNTLDANRINELNGA